VSMDGLATFGWEFGLGVMLDSFVEWKTILGNGWPRPTYTSVRPRITCVCWMNVDSQKWRQRLFSQGWQPFGLLKNHQI